MLRIARLCVFPVASPRISFFRSASTTARPSSGGNAAGSAVVIGALSAVACAGVYWARSSSTDHHADGHVNKALDYQAVAKEIAKILEKDPDYDGIGHYGPVLVRLAWHSAGTYDAQTKSGGSDGATMRFKAEASHGANAGLKIARDLLEPIKQKFGVALSYSDLWTLAGVVAIKEMGGPSIPWHPGRRDQIVESKCPPEGRLPDATQGSDHLRKIFYRMGFNDREIVCLSGAHALGKCHTDRSGFKGPWTFAPTTFSNMYFTELLGQTWVPKKADQIKKGENMVEVRWEGPLQYEDEKSKSLVMVRTVTVKAVDVHVR